MSKDIVKNYGKSIRSKLLNIAKNEDVYYHEVMLFGMIFDLCVRKRLI